MKRWSYTLILLVAYIGLFQSWLRLSQAAIVASGLLFAAVLVFIERRFARSGYFWNRWDRFIHAAVIADIVLEAVLVRFHDGRGFYLCAFGFGLVIAAYRAWLARRNKAA